MAKTLRRAINDRPHLFKGANDDPGTTGERFRQRRFDPTRQRHVLQGASREQDISTLDVRGDSPKPRASKQALRAGILIKLLPPTLMTRSKATY